ncbi:MAG: hypothetical protein GX762_03105 [Bacteroidales bacterium]|nr:hypothetical protein [Bacteroidales bacterium]
MPSQQGNVIEWQVKCEVYEAGALWYFTIIYHGFTSVAIHVKALCG